MIGLKKVMVNWILLTVLTYPGIKDLFLKDFFWSHDGPFHVVRLMHFFKEIMTGQWPVRLGTNMAYGYGYPTFNFFYPLTYYLGSLVKMTGVGFGDSIRILNILAVLISIWGMYAFLRGHFSKTASFLGALVFMYTPYRFLAMYVNGAMGIVLALAIVPWIFWAIDYLKRKRSFLAVAILGSLGSLLPLAHNVSLVIFSLPILFYAILTLSAEAKKDLELVKKMLLSGVLAILLSAFFWFPAITEMKLVGLGSGVAANYKDNFPTWKQMFYSPWGYEYSNPGTERDGMSMQIGFANIVVIAIGFLISLFTSKSKKWVFLNYLVVCSLMGVYLMSPSSLWVWDSIDLLKQIQFPWRILMVTTFFSPIIFALLIDLVKNTPLKVMFCLGVIGLMMVNNRNYLRTWERIRYPDTKFSDPLLFYGSTDIAWEAKPEWVKIKPYFRGEVVNKLEKVVVGEIVEGNNPRVRLATNSNGGGKITFNLFYWPSWEVKIDQQKVAGDKELETGLLVVEVPAGSHSLEIKIGQTRKERVGNGLSLVGLFGLMACLAVGNKRNAKMINK